MWGTFFRKKCARNPTKSSSACFRSGNEIVAVAFAHWALDPVIRFGVVHELFLLRIPLEFSADAEGDDAEMTDRGGTMADFCVADGLFTGADAIEEILHVIAALVEASGI